MKKLNLRKEVVAHFENEQMKEIAGGNDIAIGVFPPDEPSQAGESCVAVCQTITDPGDSLFCPPKPSIIICY